MALLLNGTSANAIKAWSYSRYACYVLCPLQFKLRYIDKVTEPTAPAMERGNRVHKATADYLCGRAELPPEAAKFSRILGELRQFDEKIVEVQWGFTASWAPTGWFAKNTWFRNILDAAVLYDDMTGDVLDWKTGKRYGTNAEQMELNAVAFMQQYKPVTAVTSRMVYFDSGEEDTAEFNVKDREKLIAKWNGKVAPLFNDTIFAPRPNDKCKFCHFSKSNSGHCRFG